MISYLLYYQQGRQRNYRQGESSLLRFIFGSITVAFYYYVNFFLLNEYITGVKERTLTLNRPGIIEVLEEI